MRTAASIFCTFFLFVAHASAQEAQSWNDPRRHLIRVVGGAIPPGSPYSNFMLLASASCAKRITLGDVKRFKRGKQVSSYLGLIPREHSSSSKQRLGSMSKQGNSFLRMLLVESAQSVPRLDEGFRKQYQRRCHHMAKGVAKVAAARRLSVRLFWMLRTNTAYPEIVRIESSPAEALVGGS